MDGMDTLLGADYIFSDNIRFLMTEFKYDKNNLKKEADKPRRLKLCKYLDSDAYRAIDSIHCHYIAWSISLPENKKRLYFNQYKPQICNQEIFGAESNLENLMVDNSCMRTSKRMISEFINHEVGVSFKQFDDYVSWLLSIDDSGASGVEILIDDPDNDECDFLVFESLPKLKVWLDRYSPQPKQEIESDDSEPEGPGPSF